eukprot:scaffold3821_cov134-Isochrysis_galbana.AAC.11
MNAARATPKSRTTRTSSDGRGRLGVSAAGDARPFNARLGRRGEAAWAAGCAGSPAGLREARHAGCTCIAGGRATDRADTLLTLRTRLMDSERAAISASRGSISARLASNRAGNRSLHCACSTALTPPGNLRGIVHPDGHRPMLPMSFDCSSSCSRCADSACPSSHETRQARHERHPPRGNIAVPNGRTRADPRRKAVPRARAVSCARHALDGKAGGFDGQRHRASYFWTTTGLVLHVNANCGAGKGR